MHEPSDTVVTSDARGSRRLQTGCVWLTWCALAASFVGAGEFRDQPLHHVPTVVALLWLHRAARRGTLGDASMLCVLAFLWLHIVGARWVYSYVPYDDWSRSLFGRSISETFGFTRNHYDRLVHLLYGVLAMTPVVELSRSRLGLGRRAAIAFAFAFVLASGALYEIFEWVLAAVASPETADRYNGQQGDAFDAQKDMALAAIGALVTAACQLVRRDRALTSSGTTSAPARTTRRPRRRGSRCG